MFKITAERAKQIIPPSATGIAVDKYVNQKMRMTYSEFLKIPKNVEKSMKKKLKSVTYWTGESDGPQYAKTDYYNESVEIKINGSYVFEFRIVRKYVKGKFAGYVVPNKRNSNW